MRERETTMKKTTITTTKTREDKSNKVQRKERGVRWGLNVSSPDTFQALYQIADEICCLPSWFRPYSYTNLCSFLSATECSCNLYRITKNLRPLSESSENFVTVNFNVTTFLRNVYRFFFPPTSYCRVITTNLFKSHFSFIIFEM